jgi:signal transduction histidine kinase
LWGAERLLGEHMGPLNKEQRESIGEICKSGKNMSELVNGFMEVTKMESTGFAIKREEVDLPEICDASLKELECQILEKKTVIIKHYGVDIPHLNIGKKAATIIFQNLLTNAIKYTPEGGTVEIKIDKIPTGVSISVKDNGYGIPEAAKSRIFSKLFRADNVREKEPTGTGLGLYLLKSLVDKIGGKVWFESKEGEGSTFSVELK